MACLAKDTELYFTETDRDAPCLPPMLTLQGFWDWHPRGEKDAQICEGHARLANQRLPARSFLVEKIHEAWQAARKAEGRG